ncbi:MAG: hypothetical protein OXI57_11865 [Rhodospirillales bacterium]|nr:hypothetical protein [Rhodospirillales bacterium]
MSVTAKELFNELLPPPPIHVLFGTPVVTSGDQEDHGLHDFLRDPIAKTQEFLDETREFREKLAALRSEAKREREASRETAEMCWGLACQFYENHAVASKLDDQVSKTMADLIEDIAIELEDIAESEALAASKPFANSVKRELERLGSVTQKDVQT